MYQIVNRCGSVLEVIGYCCELSQVENIIREKYRNILKNRKIQSPNDEELSKFGECIVLKLKFYGIECSCVDMDFYSM